MEKVILMTVALVAALTGTPPAPLLAESWYTANDDNIDIPDKGSVWRSLNISGVPAGRRVTKVEYRIRVDDRGDPRDFYCGDYEIYLSNATHGGAVAYLNVYDNLGAETDGGYDDDAEDDSDIDLNWRTTHAFDGELVDQTWYVGVTDKWPSAYGLLDYVELRIYSDTPVPDLTCENLTVSPKPVVIGGYAGVNVQIKNVGTGSAGGFTVKFYVSQYAAVTASDRYLGESQTSSLNAGSSVTVRVTFECPAVTPCDAGWYIGCIVDADDEVMEANEGNNTCTTRVTIGCVPPGNIRAEYYNNADFTSLAMTRQENTINYDWGTGSPDSKVDADTFSVRWMADLIAPASELFTFLTRSDDGVRLWLDGALVIDNWTDHDATEDASCPIQLAAGQRYSLCMEFYEYDGQALAQLYWDSPLRSPQIIPASAFAQIRGAHAPQPMHGATRAPDHPILTWASGSQVSLYKVYLGTSPTALFYRAQQAGATFDPGVLDWGQTYYWRIDTLHTDGSTTQGQVWRFTVADSIVLDDFEEYYPWAPARVFDTWVDGRNDPQNRGFIGFPEYPFHERDIVHGGRQSTPFFYDNSASPYLSEAWRDFTGSAQDWTANDVNVLTLWCKGIAPGQCTWEGGNGDCLMSAQGRDIGGSSDEFHFAYKSLSGRGSIQAKVEGVSSTNGWAKAGVMIRETLAPDSPYAIAFVTPTQGCAFAARLSDGQNAGSASSRPTQECNATAPLWVRLERGGDNSFSGSYSTDGSKWIPMSWSPQVIPMPMDAGVYIGLCLTSHDTGETCRARFTDVSTTGYISRPNWWDSQEIGIAPNWSQPMYIGLMDAAERVALRQVSTDVDPISAADWKPLCVPLQAFAGDIDLSRVKRLWIGVGDIGDPHPGGSGRVYIDDVGLQRMVQEVTWIAGVESPHDWSITANPTTSDVLHFSTRLFIPWWKRREAEQTLGVPVLNVDPTARTVELVFEPSIAGPPCAVDHYDPVCGVEGWFGPLPAGTWRIFCTHDAAAFSGDFTVTPGR